MTSNALSGSAALADAAAGSEIVESDEMRPQWFDFDAAPLEQMWADDRHWLPTLLGGQDVVGAFVFEDQATIAAHEVRALPRGEYEGAKHDFALLDAPPPPGLSPPAA